MATASVENTEKIPPQSTEAETAVLGSMLIEEEAIAKAIELLDENCFYKDANKKIFSSILSLYEERKAVDLITLIDKLKKDNILDEIGGSSYLTSLTTAVPTAANITHYAKIVKEKSLLRNLINTATQIVTESYENQGEIDNLLDKAERLIFDITNDKVETKFVPLKEIIKDSIEVIDSLYQRKENVTGIPTGYHDLDVMTAGLQSSDLIIIAGRPSMGKSAFVTCIAEHIGIIEKIPVAFFSLEMSKEQLVQRMLCSHARVDAHKVRTGFLSQSDWPRLTNAAGKLSEAPIFIDDSPGLSVLELRAKARRLKSQHDIRLVVVDYMQLMQGPPRSESRQQEISEISRSLKALARELNVPLIGVSQLSRAVEQRSDHRPQLSDLRESGAIEQDADLVMLLLREEYYTPSEENKGLAEVIIAKQRNGPTGNIKLTFISEYARFESIAKRSVL
ncbi:MAG: replicative DNA helicase [Candidatus Omnitrophica bacterium CG07_land_8_20_14_0_80_42_15]|uniref:Replicative DNA helicase n=1 Tax=Candidatus Aquitaenariimonas noxiae TaxID=1974741 RepID=A0A2J0KUV1_9BACT|nr:MAG: replicative DNA helicase [Candidatus Omnitrophica bacterium CG07_land_8_20_14_0_80_42_15]